MENAQTTVIRERSINMAKSTTLRASIYTSLGLILYFLIMRLFNLHRHLEFHYFNIVVLFIGLRYVIKRIISQKGGVKYFEGLKAGLYVTIISTIAFNVFLMVYETAIDTSFLEFLKENISFGMAFPIQSIIFQVAGVITAEGLASGFILTFMLMQYYKDITSETL